MSLISATGNQSALTPKDAAEKMEALLLQQLLKSAHLTGGNSSAPGASIRGDLFAEALSEAVAKSGGLGIAHLFEPKAESTQKPLIGSKAGVEASGEAPRDSRHV